MFSFVEMCVRIMDIWQHLMDNFNEWRIATWHDLVELSLSDRRGGS